jgi:phage gp36-like protein
MATYFAKADLEDRISAKIVARLFDDDANGTADTNPLNRLISDASSKVDSYLRGIYPLPLSAPYPNEVVRLALDVAVAYCAQRHPEVVRRDWEALMKAAEVDLKRLRNGETRLDIVATPEPAANHGASFTNDNAERTEEAAETGGSASMFGDMGDFGR